MNALESDARVKELRRGLEETTGSISWRITAPLRWLSRVRPTELPTAPRQPGESLRAGRRSPPRGSEALDGMSISRHGCPQ